MHPLKTEGITFARDEPIVILGAGRLALHLAAHLRFAGVRNLCVWNRSPLDEARSALLSLEIEGVSPPRTYFSPSLPESEIRTARLILLTAADDALVPLAGRLAHDAPPASDCPVLHCSGALPGNVLLPLEPIGCPIGSLHPLQTFSGVPAKYGLRGTFFAIDGHPMAVTAARTLVSWLEGKPIVLKPEGKVLYHTSAVMASNLLVALVSIAVDVLRQATGDKAGAEDPLELLLPLIEGTLINLRQRGLSGALTGPISRGDVNVVASHLESLAHGRQAENRQGGSARIADGDAGDRRADHSQAEGGQTVDPGSSELALRVYQLLSRQAVRLAQQQGVAKDKCEALIRLLTPECP